MGSYYEDSKIDKIKVKKQLLYGLIILVLT